MTFALYKLIINIISFYIFILLAYVIASWLVAFNVINPRNQIAGQILSILNALVEPVVQPLRKIIPPVGGLDLSVLVLFFGLYFLQDFLYSLALRAV